MIADLEQELLLGRSSRISAPSSTCHLIEIGGQRIFYKIARKSPGARSLRRFEQQLFHKLMKQYCPFYRVNFSLSSETELVKKEVYTLRSWNKSKINSPRVLDSSMNSLAMEYFEGLDFKSILNKGDYSKLDSLIQTNCHIRDVAKSRGDSWVIHSDNHLGNYVFSNGKAHAIDPAPVPQSKNFELIDAAMNLMMVYDFNTLKIPDLDKLALANRFLDSLDSNTKNMMGDLHSNVGTIIFNYSRFRLIAGRSLLGKIPSNIYLRYEPSWRSAIGIRLN